MLYLSSQYQGLTFPSIYVADSAHALGTSSDLVGIELEVRSIGSNVAKYCSLIGGAGGLALLIPQVEFFEKELEARRLSLQVRVDDLGR